PLTQGTLGMRLGGLHVMESGIGGRSKRRWIFAVDICMTKTVSVEVIAPSRGARLGAPEGASEIINTTCVKHDCHDLGSPSCGKIRSSHSPPAEGTLGRF